MRYIGIDYGSKKVGIALSDERGTMAFPHAVIPNNSSFLEEIIALIRGKEVGEAIIGASYDNDGTPNEILEKSETFARELEKHADIPVHFEPEFYTSQEAIRIQGRTDMTDASAAALILNSYLGKKK